MKIGLQQASFPLLFVVGRASPQALNQNKKMSGDLPSFLLITKNFVATSGEEKFYHPTQPKNNSEPKESSVYKKLAEL